MKKLKSLLDQEGVRALLANIQPLLAQARVLAQKYGAIAFKYARIGGQKAWVVLQRLPIASLSFARALAQADYAEELRALHAVQSSSPGLGAPRSASRSASPAVSQAVSQAASQAAATPAERAKGKPQSVALEKAPPDSALLLLSLLQKEGRFIDFMQEDVASYSDQEVGAAARVVHQGCGKVLDEYLHIAPVRSETEGAQVTLEPGFNPSEVRPTGQFVGEPPFTGALVHRGWKATDIQLPKIASSHDLRILAAAEVEL